MTATEELRRLLDERGVEWRNNDTIRWASSPHERSTIFDDANGNQVVVTQALSGNLAMNGRVGLTPAEAIEATLGRGECRNVSDPPEGFLCSECGWGDFNEPSHLLTSACYAGIDGKGPRYCPNCGAMVV